MQILLKVTLAFIGQIYSESHKDVLQINSLDSVSVKEQ